jgi:hypothetical protein
MTGAELIAAERERQIVEEGWTTEHDAEHTQGELALAAVTYAFHAVYRRSPEEMPGKAWPWWDEEDGQRYVSWWKPSESQVRNLVKAGALIAAEIDRLLRLAS